MLSSAKRRISILERSIQVPATTERFMARVAERVQLTGVSFEDALESMVVSLGDQELESLVREFDRLGFYSEQAPVSKA
jgi:hypothetical protein